VDAPTRVQEKNASKDEVDTAVNKLKQLKLELEAAVKVCGARRKRAP
jgi:hypothetical protein